MNRTSQCRPTQSPWSAADGGLSRILSEFVGQTASSALRSAANEATAPGLTAWETDAAYTVELDLPATWASADLGVLVEDDRGERHHRNGDGALEERREQSAVREISRGFRARRVGSRGRLQFVGRRVGTFGVHDPVPPAGRAAVVPSVAGATASR